MSHHNQEIICPNCGFKASHNYCAQCGQETHLHKDTFWGLVMHFIGHYFHYDSKFWKTVKALLTKPGKLTVAYWNKQRMRYIPPVSLYIFLSAVFFLILYLTGASHKALYKDAKNDVIIYNSDSSKRADSIRKEKLAQRLESLGFQLAPKKDSVVKRPSMLSRKRREMESNPELL